MSWAGESGPITSGLYTYTDDGSPGELTGSSGHVVIWENGTPEFMPQASLTGVEPSEISQIGNVSNSGAIIGEVLKWDGLAWTPSSDIAGTGDAGDVNGPGSSTDNAIARWDGTTGKAIQNSNVIVDDNNNVNLPSGSTYQINGVPLVIDDLADVSTSGVDAPITNEFLGWDGSQWRPSTPVGQGGPPAYATGALDSITTGSTTFIQMPDMTLSVPSGNWHCLFSSTGSHNKNGQFGIVAIFANGTQAMESTRELGGQSDNRGNFNSQALIATTGDDITVQWRQTSAAGGGPLVSVFERLFIAVEVDIQSNGS